MIVTLVLLDFLLQRVARVRDLRRLAVALPLHFLEHVDVLAAQNVLFREFHRASVRSEALQVVRSRAGDALQDLDRVARNAATAAVVQGAPEARLVLVVCVDVNILVLLQAAEVVVLLARTDDALFDLVH